jgi:4-alpha-glucanotransferase
VHLLPLGTTPEQFEQTDYQELGDFVAGSFEVVRSGDSRIILEREGVLRQADGSGVPLLVRKSFAFGEDRRVPTLDLTVDVTNTGDRPVEALLGIEWALNMLGGGGNPSAWYAVGGDRGGFDVRRAASGVDHVSMGNDHIGIELESRPQPAASAWWSSIETISVSESGFEGNHQGGCLLWVWPLSLAPGASSSVRLANLVRTFVDRAEEEGL